MKHSYTAALKGDRRTGPRKHCGTETQVEREDVERERWGHHGNKTGTGELLSPVCLKE